MEGGGRGCQSESYLEGPTWCVTRYLGQSNVMKVASEREGE